MKSLTSPLLLVLLSVNVFAQDYEARKQQYLDSAQTNGYDDAIVLQAYLGDPISQVALDQIYNQFEVRSTIDFVLVRLVRAMFLSDGSYDSQIVAEMETLPYWINYNDTLHNYWTENHMIMWMSSEWLMHERHGWEIDNNLKQRLLHYLNLKLDVGFYEFYSSTYLPLTLSGLMNLADFAEDQEIKQKAEAVAKDLLRKVMFISNTEGVFFPAAGRNYAGRYTGPYNSGIASFLYLTGNLGPCPSGNAERLNFLVTSQIDFSELEQEFVSEADTLIQFGHTPEEALLRHDSLYYVDELMMLWSSGMYFHPYIADETVTLMNDSNFWGHVDFTDFEFISGLQLEDYGPLAEEFDELTVGRTDCSADIAFFKKDEITMMSLQDYWKGKIGFQQWPMAANVAGTCVYTASGAVEPDWQARNNSNFNEHLPYISQDGNVALVMYRPQETNPLLPYNNKDVALHWRDDDFDSIDESGNWIFGLKEESFIAVRRACIGEINSVRACETDGGQTWVFIIGNEDMYGSYADFQNLVGQSTFSEEWTSNQSGDSTYYASIDFDGTSIDYSWGPEPPFTSVEEKNKNELSIYPNPNNGNFNVSIPELGNEQMNLEVFDILGNLVHQQAVSSQGQVSIQLDSNADGTYLLRLSSDSSVWTGKAHKLP